MIEIQSSHPNFCINSKCSLSCNYLLGWTSSVAYLNALNNARLRAYRGVMGDLGGQWTSHSGELGMRLISHPITPSSAQSSYPGTRDMVVATTIMFAFSFLPPLLSMYLVEDRHSRAKLLQLLNGLSPFMYWLGIASFLIFHTLCRRSGPRHTTVCCGVLPKGWLD